MKNLTKTTKLALVALTALFLLTGCESTPAEVEANMSRDTIQSFYKSRFMCDTDTNVEYIVMTSGNSVTATPRMNLDGSIVSCK